MYQKPPKKSEEKQTCAVIYNFCGHPIPQNVFDVLKGQGYVHFTNFAEHIAIDNDQPLWEQVEAIMHNFLTRKDQRGNLSITSKGDKFFIGGGHTVASMLIYDAISSILGDKPYVIMMGIKEGDRFEREVKAIVSAKAWSTRWRNEGRREYVLNLPPKGETNEL